MKKQTKLFEIIKRKVFGPKKWVEEVSSVLHMSHASVYRRESGEVPLDMEQVGMLSDHFGIDIGEIFHGQGEYVHFRYLDVDVNDMENYRNYINGIIRSMVETRSAIKREIIFCADDIPIFHLMAFPDLTYFKLYVWSQWMGNIDHQMQFEEFVYKMKRNDIEPLFSELKKEYESVSSREIWTENTIDPFLRLLDYYENIGSFSDPGSLGKLLDQLESLREKLEKYTIEKEKVEGASFELYITPLDFGSSQMVSMVNERSVTSIKLYTINSIMTADTRFQESNLRVIKGILSKSTCLSHTSERERVQFFKGFQFKIDQLRNKLMG